MRHFLFNMTVVAGLVTSLASVAASDLDSCLSDNSDKKDKLTICLDQLQQQMRDTKKQELQQKYNQAVSDLNKPASNSSSSNSPASSAPAGTANTGSSTPSTETPASTNTTPSNSASSSSDTSTNSSETTTSEKKSVNVKPAPREKPTGVQWY